MTDYELLDVRANSIGMVHKMVTFWTTTTFALVATAYVAGPDLGWVVSVGIAVLYVALAAANSFTTWHHGGVAVGVGKDLEASMASSDDPPEAVRASISKTDNNVPQFALVFQAVGSLAAAKPTSAFSHKQTLDHQ